jgi:hypothetical protein
MILSTVKKYFFSEILYLLNKRIILFINVLSLFSISNAQESSTLFFMHTLPQSNLTNPAVQIPCKVFVGMPLLSSIHFNYTNSYFSYNDIIVHTPDDSLKINVDHFNTKPGTRQDIALELHVSLINFGFLYKNYYFNFNLSDKVDAGIVYPTNWARLILKGNKDFIGQTMDLGNTAVSATYYREWAFGVSKIINDKLTLGAKVKLLFGKGNISTSRSDLNLYTADPVYYLTGASDAKINASPLLINLDPTGKINSIDIPNSKNPLALILNSRNKGLAFDFGTIFKYNERITLSGSILDLGFIRWVYYPVEVSNRNSFTYRGVTNFLSIRSFENIKQMLDSIQTVFNFQTNTASYTTFLSPKIYLGGTYDITRNLNAGLLSRSILYNGKFQSSLTASINARYKNYLAATISWSYMNNTINNIGGGLSLRSPNFGFYIISDNVYGAFKYKSARLINIRFGFNFLFGCASCDRLVEKPSNKKGCAIYREAENKKQRFLLWKKKMKKNDKK